MTRTIAGFDYRLGRAIACDRTEFREMIAALEHAGATHRRIAGDLTYFDAHGRMLIELYDKTNATELAR